MIKPQELKYEHPKKPFMKTTTSEVYKGEYHGFTVAIKRYIDPVNTNPGSVPQFRCILRKKYRFFFYIKYAVLYSQKPPMYLNSFADSVYSEIH